MLSCGYSPPQEDTGGLLGYLMKRHKEMTNVICMEICCCQHLEQVEGGSGKCSLEHTVRTPVAVVDLVGSKRDWRYPFVLSLPHQTAEGAL